MSDKKKEVTLEDVFNYMKEHMLTKAFLKESMEGFNYKVIQKTEE
jgi:hypothetical protein